MHIYTFGPKQSELDIAWAMVTTRDRMNGQTSPARQNGGGEEKPASVPFASFEAPGIDVNRLLSRAAADMGVLMKGTTVRATKSDTLWIVKGDEIALEAILTQAAVELAEAEGSEGPLVFEARNLSFEVEEDEDIENAPRQRGHAVVINVRMGDMARPLARSPSAHLMTPTRASQIARHERGIVCVHELDPAEGVRIYVPCNGVSVALPWAEEASAGPRIMLVEDEDMVRESAARMLTELGYTVIQASDGVQALHILQSEKVDLLVTDIVMPGGIDGRQLAKVVRTRREDIPVVYTTGYAHTDDPDDIVLEKPYRRREMAAKVGEALGL